MSQTQIPEDLQESHRRAEACWNFACATARLAESLHRDGSLIDLETEIVTRLHHDVSKDKRTFASKAAAEDITRASIILATGEPRASWHERAWAIADEVVSMLMAAGAWWGKTIPREKATDPDLEDWAPRETKLAEHVDRLQEIVSKNREKLLAGIRQEVITAADIRRERETLAASGRDAPPCGWSKSVSLAELAGLYGKSERTVRRWLSNGVIRSKQLDTKNYLVAIDDLPKTKR